MENAEKKRDLSLVAQANALRKKSKAERLGVKGSEYRIRTET